MTATIDPTAVLNFLFVDPIQWWYWAVGVGVVASLWVIKSSVKKNVVADISKSSPLATAEEYGSDKSEESNRRIEQDMQYRHRDAVLETIIHRPRLPNTQAEGDGKAIDRATEYMIASAMINSAKYVRFRNIKIPTKFGELVFDNEETTQVSGAPAAVPTPEIPKEDKAEEASQ